MIPPSAIEDFRASLRGSVLTPTDPAYDDTRRIFNAMIDHRPALIARCVGAADVVACVQFGRSQGLHVSARGGGHNPSGKSVIDGGLMIDLAPMKGCRVDPLRRTVRAEPGLTLGEFDRECQAFGLATTMGVVSGTGIAGLTLGGGIGWICGKYRLACDNLLSADVITADGRLRSASPDDNPDLFWATRGGGGNVGIVTSFEYRLHEVGPVLGGGVVPGSVHPNYTGIEAGLSATGDIFEAIARRAGTTVAELSFGLAEYRAGECRSEPNWDCPSRCAHADDACIPAPRESDGPAVGAAS